MALPCVAHALPGIRGLTPYQPGKPIEELQRELGLRDVIKLASNENPLGASPKARAAAEAALAELQLYPDGSGFRLKQALAKRLDVTTSQITLGNGSNEILELLARVFLAPDRAALFSEYAFAVYPIVTQAVGAEARVAPARPAHDAMPYGHDLSAFRSLLDKGGVRLVFIANPNNPTGTWLAAKEIEDFLDWVPEDVVVVLDEAYYEYMDEALRPDSRRLLESNPNLVLTRTFSKVYGLAALRIGYSVSHPELADLLNRARQPFNNNSLALAAAEAALGDAEHLRRSVENNREGLGVLKSGLEAMGLRCLPSQANFLSFDLGRPAGATYDALLQQGVIVRPLAPYAMPNHLRVTVGAPVENARFLEALQRVF
jgi:histidinol-phosphate aminotransferase